MVSRQRADISTDLNAAVVRLTVRAGSRFAAEDTLIAFDCRRQEAELAAAKAQLREAKLTVENNLYLRRRGALGDFDLEISKARHDKAKADVALIAARMVDCEIKAPFAGVVSEVAIQRFERPQPGKPILALVSAIDLEIELIVPSEWLGWIAIGTPFRFRIEELARDVAARVVRLGGEVDAVSQTIALYAAIAEPPEALKPGMSGTADFTAEARRPSPASERKP